MAFYLVTASRCSFPFFASQSSAKVTQVDYKNNTKKCISSSVFRRLTSSKPRLVTSIRQLMPDSFSATSFPSNIEERNYQYLKAISAMQTRLWPQRLCLVGHNNYIAVNAVKLEKTFYIWILSCYILSMLFS
jgi:trans-aconitate methyltransferase